MTGMIPFNKKNAISNVSYEDIYFMLDDFFGDGWRSNRNLLRDTFKIDVKETDHEYIIDAELPGVKKEEPERRESNPFNLCMP